MLYGMRVFPQFSILCLGTFLSLQSGFADGIDFEKGRQFWAFKAPVRADPPNVQLADWPDGWIDRFVLSKLESEGNVPARDLDRLRLVRRVYFDLHGLPPTPEQIDAFLADQPPGALERLVVQLLESPRFGERWGRHWLDVVRFSESTGGGRTMILPDSWRYRDYVIESLNADKPYDRFLTEQIAGDLLPDTDPKIRRENLIATTYLALGPSNYELQDKELLRMEVIDEQVDTVGRTFLSMTLGCARCHDHMFDPISAKDYYALAGIFHSTKTVEHSNVSKWLLADLPPVNEEEANLLAAHTDYRRRFDAAKKAIKDAEDALAKLKSDDSLRDGIVVDDDDGDTSVTKTGEWVASTIVKKWVGKGYLHDRTGTDGLREITFTPELPESGPYEVRVAYCGGAGRSTSVPVTVRHDGGETTVNIDQSKTPSIDGLLTKVGIFEFSKGKPCSVTVSNKGKADGVVIADAVQWLPAKKVVDTRTEIDEEREALNKRIEKLHKELKEVVKSETKKPALQTMTVRDEAKPGDCHLSINGNVHEPGDVIPRSFPEVIQTRYQAEFTDASSGRLELAKWLTAEDHPLTARVMVNRIWKHLIGSGIVQTPDNFGSTGMAPTHPELLDSLALQFIENGWSIKSMVREIVLSRSYRTERAQPRRLDAEELRDAMLLVSGKLDLTMGGATIKQGTNSEFGYKFESNRRSIYLPVFRNALPDLFAVFDFPDPNLVNGDRTRTTLPTQALYFLNHPFIIQQSGFAAKTEAESQGQWIKSAYRRCLGRLPTLREQALAETFLGRVPDLKTMAAFYQSLFACIDFRYVD
jgi:hypothetical protein